jgi:D-alanine-D-alanine ligase
MVKSNKHIEIVRSSKTSLISMGKKSCDMIRGVLEQYYEQVGVTVANDTSDLEALVAKQPDLVFLGTKRVLVGDNPDEASAAKVWVSAYLDEQGVNYSGSTAGAIELDFDKPAAKRLIEAAGLATTAYFVTRPGQYHAADELPFDFPLFIKPPNGGGGAGIGADSVARDFTAFEQKVRSIADNFHSPALAETYLPGREFSVAILETAHSEKLLAMPVELITEQNQQGDRILGKSIKNADTERVIAVPNGPMRQAIVELATGAYEVLGARDYGRIDIRLDESGTPHFLEANLVPGLSHHDFISYFTRACWASQAMDYEAMILYIVELGLTRVLNIEQSLPGLSVVANTLLPPLTVALKPV